MVFICVQKEMKSPGKNECDECRKKTLITFFGKILCLRCGKGLTIDLHDKRQDMDMCILFSLWAVQRP